MPPPFPAGYSLPPPSLPLDPILCSEVFGCVVGASLVIYDVFCSPLLMQLPLLNSSLLLLHCNTPLALYYPFDYNKHKQYKVVYR